MRIWFTPRAAGGPAVQPQPPAARRLAVGCDSARWHAGGVGGGRRRRQCGLRGLPQPRGRLRRHGAHGAPFQGYHEFEIS